MAKLSVQEALDLIKTPVNKDKIAQAVKQESRLQFHCEPFQEKSQLPQAYGDFIAWVSTFLPADKMKRFQQLLPCPVDTVESTKTIFNELNKVYEADDKFIKFDFVSEEIEADANEYAGKIKDLDYWKTKGFDAFKTGICSLIVVDLPQDQKDLRPEPYYYLLSISRVIDVVFFEDGNVSYVIFRRGDGKINVIDEQSFMVFQKPEDTGEYSLFFETKHSFYSESGDLISGLGYTPVKSFFDQAIAKSNHINKKGPITNALAKLDWLLFWRTSKKYFDLYGAWPIMVQYKRTCSYRDEEHNECVAGYVNYNYRTIVDGQESFTPHQKLCPVCSGQSTLGPGTKWDIDPPKDKDDVDLMANPIKFVEVSTDKLEWVVTETERLENEVYLDCVGWDGDAMNRQAVNDDQVAANLVSKEAVLDSNKVELQKAHKFGIDTVFRFRYGDYFLGSTIDYGSNFFLKTASQLTAEYKEAKEAGMPSYIVADLRDKVNRTANRNNPERLNRNQILEQLEPYLDLQIDQLTQLKVPDIDPIGYIIKINFNTFIQRFEREQTNILQFASLLPFNIKISKIQSILESYAKAKNPIPRDDAQGA